MTARIDTCALCPRLCRPACPVTTGSQREAAVPAVIAGVLLQAERGLLPDALAVEALTLCVDCGACQAHCHIHHPLPDLLRAARAERVPPPDIAPLQPIEGGGERIVVEADGRPLAAALAHRLGVPVRRWVTSDRLGVVAVEHGSFAAHAAALREAVGGATVIVADGGVAHALEAAGVEVAWVQDVVEVPEALGSCRRDGHTPPLACCGGAGPLAAHHPADAGRVAEAWIGRAGPARVADARCRAHLRACGHPVEDVVDALIAEET